MNTLLFLFLGIDDADNEVILIARHHHTGIRTLQCAEESIYFHLNKRTTTRNNPKLICHHIFFFAKVLHFI